MNTPKQRTAVPAPSTDPAYEVHALKTWPAYFKDILVGGKTFEVRKDDRPFRVGDVLRLEEFDPRSETYTGRVLERRVSYVLPGGQFGVEDGYVVMAFAQESAC